MLVASLVAGLEFWATFVVALILLWLFVSPGGLVIVGLVLESRMTPLIDRQYRSFFPGDLFNGFAAAWFVASATSLDVSVWDDRLWLIDVGVFVIAGIAAYNVHHLGHDKYPIRKVHSPTRKFHDLVLYWFYGTFIGSIFLADIIGVVQEKIQLITLVPAFIGMLLWFGTIFWDHVVEADKEDARSEHAHVTWGEPIWKTRHITWRY